MAAGDLRYEWFAEIASENGFHSISTAHHLNDSVETALLNFVRGTSLPGLSGIAVQKELNTRDSHTLVQLLRPLLFATRDEILDFAKARQIVWREDSSNASDDYARNFVRHHIVPQLETLNPNFLDCRAEHEEDSSADENLVFLLNQWLDLNGQTSGQTSNSVVEALKKQNFPNCHRHGKPSDSRSSHLDLLPNKRGNWQKTRIMLASNSTQKKE